MSRHSFGLRTGAGSTTLPIISLYGIASRNGHIREVGCFNTTAVAFAIKLARFSTAGTAAAQTATNYDDDKPAQLSGRGTHTVGPTITAGNIRIAAIGAAIGAGVIWTFGGEGLLVPAGVANGVGLVVAVGTGAVADCYIDWEE